MSFIQALRMIDSLYSLTRQRMLEDCKRYIFVSKLSSSTEKSRTLCTKFASLKRREQDLRAKVHGAWFPPKPLSRAAAQSGFVPTSVCSPTTLRALIRLQTLWHRYTNTITTANIDTNTVP